VCCRYEPLFDYFKECSDSAFRVVADNYVTDDSGTGIVHCAPAFGEDDYRVCIENQVISKVFFFLFSFKHASIDTNLGLEICHLVQLDELVCIFCVVVILTL
jgi:hypothetical protein